MEVGGSVQGDEEVNLEYLRNVILQFLENEKMRVRHNLGLSPELQLIVEYIYSPTWFESCLLFYILHRKRRGGSLQRFNYNLEFPSLYTSSA
jgi:hypothetical protein